MERANTGGRAEPFGKGLMARIAARNIGAEHGREAEERRRKKEAENDVFGRNYFAALEWTARSMDGTVEGILKFWDATGRAAGGSGEAAARLLAPLPRLDQSRMFAWTDVPCLGRAVRRRGGTSCNTWDRAELHYRNLRLAEGGWQERHRALLGPEEYAELWASVEGLREFRFWMLRAAGLVCSHELSALG